MFSAVVTHLTYLKHGSEELRPAQPRYCTCVLKTPDKALFTTEPVSGGCIILFSRIVSLSDSNLKICLHSSIYRDDTYSASSKKSTQKFTIQNKSYSADRWDADYFCNKIITEPAPCFHIFICLFARTQNNFFNCME